MRFMLTCLVVWSPWLSRAQPPLQVVNRVIQKTMPYVAGQLIEIHAQKADVVMKGWSRPTVSVQLKLQAKHPERSVAERDVRYHQYTLTNEGGKITIANQFVIPQRAPRVQSQLKAMYEINLPYQALATLTNSFGDIHLSELSGELLVILEFGKLTATDLKGMLGVQSSYGDIEGRNLNATLTVQAEKADVHLEDLGGVAQIRSRYGHLSVAPAVSLRTLSIEANRTAVLITPKRLADFHVEIATANATISVPASVLEHLRRAGHKQFFSYQPGGYKAEISITNKNSTVTLQGDKPLVTK